MRLLSFSKDGRNGLAVEVDAGQFKGLYEDSERYPGTILSVLRDGGLESARSVLAGGDLIDLSAVEYKPPIDRPGKIICVGLNYRDHASEAGLSVPAHPTIFARFPSSLIGHNSPLVQPCDSDNFDYEGEIAAVIGKRGRRIAKEDALNYVAGYSLFNDGSVRDVQLRTSQWTVGKNYDGSGAFGPYFVSADTVPPGCRGLELLTRLNGEIVQNASTDDLIFDIPTLVASLSIAFTLEPGDIIVTGTPSGVGMARQPPRYLKLGDVCEVEVYGLGVLRNTVMTEDRVAAKA